MAVVSSAHVVPVHAEGVQVTARCLGQGETGIRRMAGVFDVHRFLRIGPTCITLDRQIKGIRDRDRARHAIFPKFDGSGLDAYEGADQWGKVRHGSARATPDNLAQRFLLLRARALVYDQTHGPIPLSHWAWGTGCDNECEVVQRHLTVMPFRHVKDGCGRARVLCGLRGQVGNDARAQIIAVASLEIVTADLPVDFSPGRSPL